MNGLLLLAWLLPLLLAPLSLSSGTRWLPALAPLPAMATVFLVSAGAAVSVDWLLLGVTLVLDETAILYLTYSALLWWIAGVYAALTMQHDPLAGRFRLFFLLSQSGNLLLILAADVLVFYLGFAMMGLSAYGLVCHRRGQRARRAGRSYLAWTLVGEVLLFSALVLMVSTAQSTRFTDLAGQALPELAYLLLITGFGIKLALPGLHGWLPSAYAMAPVAAAAVLSGPMISAGFLGWQRFIPFGITGLASWGELLTGIGILGLVLGATAGLMQRDPGRVLGYSSILKMGLVTAVAGIALAQPAASTWIVSALALYVMHHLLVKGALFLGIGEWRRAGSSAWVLAGFGLLALSLAGAPLTAGALAKLRLEQAVGASGVEVGLLFKLAAFATMLLMARLLWLLCTLRPAVRRQAGAASVLWLALVALAIWLPFHPGELVWSTSSALVLAVAAGTGLLVARFSRQRGAEYRFPGAPPVTRWLVRAVQRFGAIEPPDLSFNGRLFSRIEDMLAKPKPTLAKAGVNWLLVFGLLLAGLAWL